MNKWFWRFLKNKTKNHNQKNINYLFFGGWCFTSHLVLLHEGLPWRKMYFDVSLVCLNCSGSSSLYANMFFQVFFKYFNPSKVRPHCTANVWVRWESVTLKQPTMLTEPITWPPRRNNLRFFTMFGSIIPSKYFFGFFVSATITTLSTQFLNSLGRNSYILIPCTMNRENGKDK